MPGPEAEHTTCLNRRGRFAGGARKLIIGWPTFGGGWEVVAKSHFLVDFGLPKGINMLRRGFLVILGVKNRAGTFRRG